MLQKMIIPMIVRSLTMVGAGEVGGVVTPAPPVYDLAGLLAYAQIAGYGSPSGGWMPHTTQPDKALILARVSGRL